MLESFKFKKSLGQNFISDTNFLNAMVADAGVTAEENVLEIGTGAGSLTQALSGVAAKVVSVEKDESLKEILDEKFCNTKNVKIIFGDFMKLTKNSLEKELKKPYKVVANLPYYITTPIIFKLIEEEFAAESLTIMIQKEVADRLKAKPGTKSYGSITVKLNRIADISVMRAAPRTLFYPQPNVDSSVVKIKFKTGIAADNIFNRAVDCAFQERRKMFASNLAREFNLPRENCADIISSCGLDINIRGEALNVSEFIKIADKLRLLLK